MRIGPLEKVGNRSGLKAADAAGVALSPATVLGSGHLEAVSTNPTRFTHRPQRLGGRARKPPTNFFREALMSWPLAFAVVGICAAAVAAGFICVWVWFAAKILRKMD